MLPTPARCRWSISTFLTAWRELPRALPSRSAVKSGASGSGPIAVGVALPSRRRRAAAACRSGGRPGRPARAHRRAARGARRSGARRRERAVVHDERAGHPGLHDEPIVRPGRRRRAWRGGRRRCTVAPLRRRSRRCGGSRPRRMSSWLSETRPNVRPTRAGRMSRTMVSTSGSSGIAPKCNAAGGTAGDFAAHGVRAASRQPMSRRKTLPSNSIASAASRLSRCASGKVGATAVTLSTRPPLTRRTPSGVARGARVEDRHARGQIAAGIVIAAPLLGPVRIAARGEHRGHRCPAGAARDRRDALSPWPPARTSRSARSATSGSTTWVSGSPSRQLNSTTHGVPSRSTISPA